jgi:hypothetical protein
MIGYLMPKPGWEVVRKVFVKRLRCGRLFRIMRFPK